MIRACVIGWPIKHSRSPLIHGYWIEKYAVQGSYQKLAVAPEDLAQWLKTLPERGFAGCNVTVPHKERAFALADVKDASAVAIGAANTLWVESGKLCAANTDSYGFMAHLAATVPDWQRSSRAVAVLGAGGAGRAIVYGLRENGVTEIRVFNRSVARAEELARHFGSGVTAEPWDDRRLLGHDVSLVVNTTTLGMNGEGSLDLDMARLADDTIVADIVYVPLRTKLLSEAQARGLRTVDGLGMLLHQAVPGFEKWFGIRPEVTPALRARLVADIEGAP